MLSGVPYLGHMITTQLDLTIYSVKFYFLQECHTLREKGLAMNSLLLINDKLSHSCFSKHRSTATFVVHWNVGCLCTSSALDVPVFFRKIVHAISLHSIQHLGKIVGVKHPLLPKSQTPSTKSLCLHSCVVQKLRKRMLKLKSLWL